MSGLVRAPEGHGATRLPAYIERLGELDRDLLLSHGSAPLSTQMLNERSAIVCYEC